MERRERGRSCLSPREMERKGRQEFYFNCTRIFQELIEIESVNIQNLVVCISISLNLKKKKINFCPSLLNVSLENCGSWSLGLNQGSGIFAKLVI